MSDQVNRANGITPRQAEIERKLGVRFKRGRQGMDIPKNHSPGSYGYCPVIRGVVRGFYTFYEVAENRAVDGGIVISGQDAHKYPIAEECRHG